MWKLSHENHIRDTHTDTDRHTHTHTHTHTEWLAENTRLF